MARALTPITLLASEFCEDIGDSHEDNHLRFSKKLLRAYKNYLFRYLCPDIDVQTTILPVSGQIELPCDFVYETKVGLLKNNCLVTLDLNKDLRLNNTKYTDSQIECDINAIFDGSLDPGVFFPFYNAFRGPNWVGELYGIGSGFHNNQWYNINNGILEIGSLVPDDVEVVLEYKSTGVKDGFKLIPDEMVEAAMYKAKSLFYEDQNRALSADMAEKYKVEYQRLKRLYNYRTPDYFAWVFKGYDSPVRL